MGRYTNTINNNNNNNNNDDDELYSDYRSAIVGTRVLVEVGGVRQIAMGAEVFLF